MRPVLRKLVLVLHLAVSVGWIGAAVAYLSIVIAAQARQDPQTVRSGWIVMELIGQRVIVPLALTSLATGIVMSLGTKWGLFRHYWVLFSLVLTIFAVAILLSHMPDVSLLAGVAADGELVVEMQTEGRAEPGDSSGDAQLDWRLVAGLQSELLHAGGGVLVLLMIHALNVFKPAGLTPYGWRRQQNERRRSLG